MSQRSTHKLKHSQPERVGPRRRKSGAQNHRQAQPEHANPVPAVVLSASQAALAGFAVLAGLSIGSYAYPLSLVFQRAAHMHSQVSIDPERKAGAPCIVGTRIPVYMVLDALEEHGSIEGVRKSYPGLTVEQIRDAVGFARFVLECPIDEVAPIA